MVDGDISHFGHVYSPFVADFLDIMFMYNEEHDLLWCKLYRNSLDKTVFLGPCSQFKNKKNIFTLIEMYTTSIQEYITLLDNKIESDDDIGNSDGHYIWSKKINFFEREIAIYYFAICKLKQKPMQLENLAASIIAKHNNLCLCSLPPAIKEKILFLRRSRMISQI